MINPKENRSEARKVLRCRATLTLANGVALRCRTIDISGNGVAINILVPDPVKVGQVCTVVFDASLNGQMRQFGGPAKAVYCICSKDGYRTGFQFASLAPAQTTLLAELLRTLV